MEQYLIVTDIDGTLIPKTQQVSDLTQAVLSKLQAQGHELYEATGRMLALARSITDQFTIPMGIISANGAVIAQADQIKTHLLGQEAVVAAYDICDRLDLAMRLFTLTDTYHTSHDESALAHMRFLRKRVPASRMISLKSRADVLAIADQVTNGLAVNRVADNRLIQARRELMETGLFSLSASSETNIELIPRGISKATALKQVQQQLGIDTEHTIVFGNGLNDIPMFETAATSVAMADAPQAVLDAATTITEPANQDGVPRFLMNRFKMN